MTALWTTIAVNVAVTAAMAVTVALAGQVPPIRRQPRLRHALWLLVVAKLVTPGIVELPILPAHSATDRTISIEPLAVHVTDAIATGCRGATTTADHSSPETRQSAPVAGPQNPRAPVPGSPRISVLVVLSIVLCIPTALLLAAALRQMRRINLLLRSAEPTGPRLSRLATAASLRMGVDVIPQVQVVGGCITPLLWIWHGRPIVVVPAALAMRLDDEQLESIICHELAHFIRRDHWTNAFVLMVAALYWWNPVAWWARRHLLAAQEESCDAMVMARARVARRHYAETLWLAMEYVNDQRPLMPMSASGFGRMSFLRRRFEMIACNRVEYTIPKRSKAFLALCATVLICLPVAGKEPADSDAENVKVILKTAAAGTPEAASKSAAEVDGGSVTTPGTGSVEKKSLNYQTAEVTVDARKHCMHLAPSSAGQGALRIELERGVEYTVRATGKAFMSDETGASADPFPGVTLVYSTDAEDGYAVRQVLLKPGDSVTFTTPWFISATDEVFAMAFFVDPWASSTNNGSYTLTFTRSGKEKTSIGTLEQYFYMDLLR